MNNQLLPQTNCEEFRLKLNNVYATVFQLSGYSKEQLKEKEDVMVDFISSLRQQDCKALIEMIGTFTPTCGYECEEEKGFQKGIQAEQSLIKNNIQDYYKD